MVVVVVEVEEVVVGAQVHQLEEEKKEVMTAKALDVQ